MGLFNKVAGVFGRIGRGLKNVVSRYGVPLGAALGSIIPGIGTALGSTIGGAAQILSNHI